MSIAKHILVLGFLLVIAPTVWSGSEVTIMIPAVAQRVASTVEESWFGVASYVTVWSEPGAGRVFVDTFPLTQIDTQGSARLAAEAAAAVAGIDLSGIDIYVVVRSDSPVIGGPSAGGALSVAILASLLNLSADPDVVMTGTINPDGTIGPIGGVVQKAEAASSVGAKMFLVPTGQTVSQTYPGSPEIVDVAEYGREELDLTVREVGDIREAATWMLGVEIEMPSPGGEIDLEKYKEIMSASSKDMLESSRELLAEAQDGFGSANLDPQERESLKQYLDEAAERIDMAEGAVQNETFYLAASYAFHAKINSNYVLYVLEFRNGDSAATALELIDRSESEVSSAKETVEGTEYTSITAFECYAAAERRIYEALRRMDQARELYLNSRGVSQILDALYGAAHARQRALSAVWWASLCDQFPADVSVDEDLLKDIAQEYVGDLQYLIAYAESVGSYSTSLLVEAQDILSEVLHESQEEAYAAAILDSLRGRSYVNAHLEIGGSFSLSVDDFLVEIREKVDREREYAKVSISTSRDFGVNPILALSRFESGDSYAKQAENAGSSDDASSLLLLAYVELKNAKLIAEMSPVISQRLADEPEDRKPPIVKPIDERIGSMTAFLIAGGCLVVGLALGSYVGARRVQGRRAGI